MQTENRRAGRFTWPTLAAAALVLPWLPALGDDQLRGVFREPPAEAKPRGYWVWPHGHFDTDAIRQELAEFRTLGLGGVDIFDLGVSDPAGIIPPGPGFLSPAQIEGIAVALDEAKKLGLAMGLIVASSWNAGGSWTPPELASMNLVAWQEEVTGPVRIDRQLPLPPIPDSFRKPYGTYPLAVPKDEQGNPLVRREVALLAAPLDAAGRVTDAAAVQLLSDRLDADGRLVCELPEGRWLLVRALVVNFGQRLWLPSQGSQGLIIDHFNPAAVKHHFETVMDRLEARVGPLAATSLERLYLASYESNADVIWTPGFAAEFARRNGYRIEPWLPALFGVTVENEETTGRFLYDYRRTVSEVFIDAVYRQARQLCHDRGLRLCSEAGGPGAPLHDVPTEDLAALGAVDVMRGEFWHGKEGQLNPDGFEQLQVVKPIASAAHIYGHRVVEMEAFTSSTCWETGLDIFRPLADRAFCEGMTRVVYHTMTHLPAKAGRPGWNFRAGTHVNTAEPWWPLSGQLHTYFARSGAVLMQGRFVADVAWYYGHAIPNFAKPKHIRPGLGLGYDYDDLNTEVLLRAEVDADGRIVLPSGMRYAVLALPPDDRCMDLAVARHLEKLARAGATIVGPRPNRTYGLRGHPQDEQELLAIAARLWGEQPASAGGPAPITDIPPRAALEKLGVPPDVEVFPPLAWAAVDWIHRRTESAEIYMVRNRGAEPVALEATFRVRGKQPELWDAARGTMLPLALFAADDRGMRLPLRLDGHGSVFVVFVEPRNARPHVVAVERDGEPAFPGSAHPATVACTRAAEGRVLVRTTLPGDFVLRLSDGSSHSLRIEADPEPVAVAGPWQVEFPAGDGSESGHVEMTDLRSWTEAEDPAIRSFSGIAISRAGFELSAEAAARPAIVLDLGEVREVARVSLNGREVGLSTFAPHRLDLTGLVRPGPNTLEIAVANTWLNRLIHDDGLPPDLRTTKTNHPGPGRGRRWRDLPPRPAGLLGPVRLEFPLPAVLLPPAEPLP